MVNRVIVLGVKTTKIPWVTNPANGKPYTQATLMHAVLSGKRPELPDGLANSVLGGLAQRCWQGSAATRPSFEMVRRHLQLGLRQSMSDLGHGPTADDGDEDYGEDSDEGVAGAIDRKLMPPTLRVPITPEHAADNKLMHTLRHNVHRSHKHSDEFNGVHRSRVGRVTSRSSAPVEAPSPARDGAPPPASPMVQMI